MLIQELVIIWLLRADCYLILISAHHGQQVFNVKRFTDIAIKTINSILFLNVIVTAQCKNREKGEILFDSCT